MVSRVISEDVPARPSDCAIETLAALPTQPYRELGTIQISAADPARHDTRVIIDQHACAMGADAVLTNPASSQGGLLEATAIAYASGLAERMAKLRAAKEVAARPPPSLPKTPVPEVEQITPAGSPPASASADDNEEELPPETLVPIRELQIGPAEAPSPTPGAKPSAIAATPTPAQPAPTASPTPTAGAMLSPASASLTPPTSTHQGSAPAPVISPASPPSSPAQTLTPIPTAVQALPPAPTVALPSASTLTLLPAPIATPTVIPTAAPTPTMKPLAATPSPTPTSSPTDTARSSLMPTPIAIPAVAKSPPINGRAGPATIPLSLFKIVPDEEPGASPAESASPSVSPLP